MWILGCVAVSAVSWWYRPGPILPRLSLGTPKYFGSGSEPRSLARALSRLGTGDAHKSEIDMTLLLRKAGARVKMQVL